MPQKCSCGAEIEFVKVGSKMIPCDPKATVYQVLLDAGGGLDGVRCNGHQNEPSLFTPTYWVTHFSTCPDAGAYSQAKSARLQQLVELLAAVDAVLEPGELQPGDPEWQRLLETRQALR